MIEPVVITDGEFQYFRYGVAVGIVCTTLIAMCIYKLKDLSNKAEIHE